MKQLDKNEALKLLESFERETIELNDLTRNAISIINSIALEMVGQTSEATQDLFYAISEICEAINIIRRYNI